METTTKMTKVEIIEELFEGYIKDPSTRGLSAFSGCAYRGTGGNRCAVGKAMTEKSIVKWGDYEDGVEYLEEKLVSHGETLDSILSEKYHGHDGSFWQELQNLHDVDVNWDESGLTEVGEILYKRLKEQFA